MNKLLASTLIVSSLLLGACAQTRGYTPAVDTRTSASRTNANLDRDTQECQALAEQAAGNTATESAIGAGVGGAVGAATGAVVGAVTNTDAGNDALIGGAIGGIGGAVAKGYQSNSQYKSAFNDCMSNRGHRVVS